MIIPVYNTAQYLDKCLASVINQTFLPYEIILVDDGSTDGSDKICDKYSLEYSFVKTIHLKNGGTLYEFYNRTETIIVFCFNVIWH